VSNDEVMTPKRRQWGLAVAVLGLLAAVGIYLWVRPTDAHSFNAALAAAGVLIGLLTALSIPPPRNPNSARKTTILVLIFGLCLFGLGIWNPDMIGTSAATAFLTLGSTLVAAIGGVFAGSL
jgi:peptidoglycan/LPS O-acetylase OafA/YrhL